MKKIYLVLIFVLCVANAAAEIKVNIMSYNAETMKARILISNTGPEDYHDITFAVDNVVPMEFPGSLLKAGTAIAVPKLVPGGMHTITITTREGAVFNEELLFPRAGEQVLQSSVRIRGDGPEAATSTAETELSQPKGGAIFFVLFLALLALGVGLFLYFRSNPESFRRLLNLFARLNPSRRQKFPPRTVKSETQAGVLQRPVARQYRQPAQRRPQPTARRYPQRPRTGPGSTRGRR